MLQLSQFHRCWVAATAAAAATSVLLLLLLSVLNLQIETRACQLDSVEMQQQLAGKCLMHSKSTARDGRHSTGHDVTAKWKLQQSEVRLGPEKGTCTPTATYHLAKASQANQRKPTLQARTSINESDQQCLASV